MWLLVLVLALALVLVLVLVLALMPLLALGLVLALVLMLARGLALVPVLALVLAGVVPASSGGGWRSCGPTWRQLCLGLAGWQDFEVDGEGAHPARTGRVWLPLPQPVAPSRRCGQRGWTRCCAVSGQVWLPPTRPVARS